MSYSEIGTALGVTPAAAYQMLMRVLEAYDRDIKEEVPRVRQIELQRLDYYLDCLQKKIKAGDVAAIGKAITIGERRAKLLGLDAPTKVAATDTDGNDLDKMSEEELQKRAAQLIINLGVVIEK